MSSRHRTLDFNKAVELGWELEQLHPLVRRGITGTCDINKLTNVGWLSKQRERGWELG